MPDYEDAYQEEFVDTFLEILHREYAKHPTEAITGYRAIEIIRLVFQELS